MGESYDPEFYEKVFNSNLPVDFTVEAPSIHKQYHITSSKTGKCSSTQFGFDKILISYSQVQTSQPVQLRRMIQGDCIEMIFALSGEATLRFNQRELHRFSVDEHNFYHGDGRKEEVELRGDGRALEFMSIHLSRSYLFRLLLRSDTHYQSLVDNILHHRQGFLSETNFAITPAMKLIIDEVKHCRKVGTVKRIFLEAKVLELLMLQLEQVTQEKSQPAVSMPSSDLNLLTEAKRIIEENVVDPPTISGLSKLIGMNEAHLKKGFRETFGMTIFGYVNQLKMEQAKYLLLVKNKSVSETAFRVGYKNPQHFTAAFKRHYGIVPSRLKPRR